MVSGVPFAGLSRKWTKGKMVENCASYRRAGQTTGQTHATAEIGRVKLQLGSRTELERGEKKSSRAEGRPRKARWLRSGVRRRETLCSGGSMRLNEQVACRSGLGNRGLRVRGGGQGQGFALGGCHVLVWAPERGCRFHHH